MVTLTAAPDWVAVALQIWVMACVPGQLKLTFQPDVAAAPGLVTVKPSWKPPLHEFTTDQVTWQLPGAVVPVAVGLGDGLGDALVGDGLGDALVGVGVGVGAAPLPLVSTTTDSAGTDTELPEKLLCVTDGLAAE